MLVLEETQNLLKYTLEIQNSLVPQQPYKTKLDDELDVHIWHGDQNESLCTY